MNRETESHFTYLPQVNIRRSSFKRPFTHKTSFNAGDLIPIYVDADILPGDTVKMEMGSLIRMQTPIFPVMDNAYMDLFWFFVPHRLVWDHFKEFWGENNLTAWEQQTEYTIPQIEAPSGGWNQGTIADYMGIPIGVDNISINHLPFRAYCKIWNDFFRDENLKDPCMITMDETTVTGTNSGDYVTYAEAGAKPLKAAKYHDQFTSALKAPQKGPSVNIPLGTTAPVYAGSDYYTLTSDQKHTMHFTGNNLSQGSHYQAVFAADSSTGAELERVSTTISSSDNSMYPDNLYADLTNAIGATINQLRQSFAIQAFYEAQARGGSRYIEMIQSIFGVTSPDARLQRPEYLGGTRFSINMDQVLQTSSTDATSPQGNTAAFSCTVSSGEMFTHSFTEHGTLMCLGVIRTDHTYQQGIEDQWLRKTKFDCYIPQFANLGEMPIKNIQLYAQGSNVTDSDGNIVDDQIFGYQEAWYSYRFKPSMISSELRSTYAQSLDYMHYGDEYSQLPTLSSGWIDETEANIDRTIAVQSSTSNQFFADFFFDGTYVRPMPIYSIPAMLNHF